MRALVLIILGMINFSAVSHASEKDCGIIGAEYVPQNPVIAESYDPNINVMNKTLSFILRVDKGDMNGTERNLFLNFDAYNKEGEKVSRMRFGDSWSNGFSRQSFSTYYGMYCKFGKDSESDCEEMKPSVGFIPIGMNKGLKAAGLSSAPDLLIFPESFTSLHYNSYQKPEHWDKYIKFYTEDRIYPDWRPYSFWVRKKCGEKGAE